MRKRLSIMGFVVLVTGCAQHTRYGADGACTPGCAGDGCAPGQWATVCAGTFTMGTPLDELGRARGEILHEVTLLRDFALQATEVTQEQLTDVMGFNPSHFAGCSNCPAEMLNWYQAAAYCNGLSARAGLDLCYECTGSDDALECEPSSAYATPYVCPGYRLPTEAEWEYAARAGTTTATYNGDLDDVACMSRTLAPVAWYCGTSDDTSHQVGTGQPNQWGLHDMLGNVFEWCHDWYGDVSEEPLSEPWGAEGGDFRVFRGGSWYDNAQYLRSGFRYRGRPDYTSSTIGFRPARTLGL